MKNNGLRTSWTWDEFKANLAQYRKDGTITIPDRAKGVTPTSTPTTTLRKGSTGSAVKELQTMLNALGYNCGTVDGDFGSKTDAALRAFQKAKKLTVDGIYGSKSRAALTAAYKAKTTSAEKIKPEPKVSYKYNGLNYSKLFDPVYYADTYADLKKAFGTDKNKLFEHFTTFGMREARKPSAKFDPKAYRKRYKDLDEAFGDNWPAYYEHWLRFGIKEKRNGA